MSTTSLAQPAQPSTRLEETALRAERILDRLRFRRPELENRIDRAERLIVEQLSAQNGYRPIRVRVDSDGGYTYRVRSGSKLSKVYTVDPQSWECDCPWSANGGRGCYHSIAAWTLELAHRPVPTKGPCTACGGLVPVGDLYEVHEDHESLTWVPGDLLCEGCALETGIL